LAKEFLLKANVRLKVAKLMGKEFGAQKDMVSLMLLSK
jgi:hypothetical protein